MFDDPKKDLKRLEAQLLAMEEPADDYTDDESWLTEEDWLDAELQEAHSLLQESDPQSRPEDIFAFLEEDVDEDEDAEPRRCAAPAPAQKPRQKKEKGIGGLVFLACLETIGILAVLIWWLLWLL